MKNILALLLLAMLLSCKKEVLEPIPMTDCQKYSDMMGEWESDSIRHYEYQNGNIFADTMLQAPAYVYKYKFHCYKNSDNEYVMMDVGKNDSLILTFKYYPMLAIYNETPADTAYGEHTHVKSIAKNKMTVMWRKTGGASIINEYVYMTKK